MNDLEILDLLSNDVKVVDSTIRAIEEKRGVQILHFPGKLMPDGKAFEAEVPKELSPTILKEWCNAVRREYDARKRRKEDQETSKNRDASGDTVGQGGPAGKPATDRPDTQETGEAVEEEMGSLIKSQVAKWARAERKAGEEVARLAALSEAAAKQRDAARAERLRAEALLDFYLSSCDASKDS